LSDPLERAKATPEVAFCFLVNQLLDRERWARERLAAFAGQCVELRPPLLPPLRLTILEDGTVRDGGDQPQAAIGLEGISGGALAEELRVLARHLRWDAEEELSRVVGDVAAHRIAGAGRAFLSWQADSARRLSEALAGYGTDEARLLIRRPQIKSFSEELERMGARITAIEARISRLV
jgi:ubiquinone biosynthesis accessory factor UbiJ